MPPFRFKHFSVSHHRSAMKVGVDGVLVACWADANNPKRILDVGTGCGVVALIMAQRFPMADVMGIDIDSPSVEEARENIASSPWSQRMSILEGDFSDENIGNILGFQGFDLVVSNPPYFNSGVSETTTPREMARHQGALSPQSLLRNSRRVLTEHGHVAMIIPSEESERTEKEAASMGFTLVRKCRVRGHERAPWKRVLLQFQLGVTTQSNTPEVESLTLEVSPGTPTDEYRALCKDFYLKF